MVRRNRRILVRFLLPYLAFLFIPILVGAAAYVQAARVLRQEIRESRGLMLAGAADVVEQQVREIRSMAEQIASDSLIRAFQAVREPFEGPNTYQVRRTIDHLFDYKNTNDFVLNYYVVFEGNGLVLGPRFCTTIADFDRYVLSFADRAMSISSLTDSYTYGSFLPRREAVYDEKPHKILTYVRSAGYPGFSSSSVVVLLSDEVVAAHLERIRTDPGSWAMIVDQTGQTLTSVGPVGSDLSGYLVTEARAPLSDWTFVAGYPVQAVWSDVQVIRRYSTAIVALSVLAGFVASVFLATRTARPMESLSALVLSGEGGDGDLFANLEEQVRFILADRRRLSAAVEEQRPLLRSALLSQLLHGRIDRLRLASLSRQAGVQWRSDAYVAAVLLLSHHGEDEGEEEEEEIRVIVANLLQQRFPSPSTAISLEAYQIGIIIALAGTDSSVLRSILEGFAVSIHSVLRARYKSGATLLFGRWRASVLGLGESYREALTLSFRAYPGSTTLFWEPGEHSAASAYNFPEGVETRLMNAVRTGNAGSAVEMLRALFHENLELRNLDETTLQVFWFELAGMVLKLSGELELVPRNLDCLMAAARRSAGHGNETVAQQLLAAVQDLCNGVEDRKRSHNEQLMGSIFAFVQDRVSDGGLSLAMVAAAFNLSEGYLSRFFKEHSGQNFIDCIEGLRMERARELLSTTDVPIKRIAADVGYRSANTFCKAFRRHNSCSAGEYRRAGQQ